MKEIVRTTYKDISKGFYIAIIAHKADVSFRDLKEDITTILLSNEILQV